jgi:UDP-glucose 4-epimerase
MRIIITGGAGFIGHYVIQELITKGHQITVADNLSKDKSKIPKNVNFINVDLTNKKRTVEAFQGHDICINLASLIGGIGYFHKLPATILSENNKIYSSTFEAVVKTKIKRMVYVSSSMVFESTNIFPSKEADINEIPPPVTGYGFSKLIGEQYCKTFNREFGLNYTIIRPFNAYGINEYPGEYVGYSHVIPDLVQKILQGQYPLNMLGDGQQTRCFTHVKDLARGIVMATFSDKAKNEDFNIGTNVETKMIDLAKILWLLCDKKKEFKVNLVEGFKHDIKRRVPDVSKAKQILGWEQKIEFKEGLIEFVDWLKYQLK